MALVDGTIISSIVTLLKNGVFRSVCENSQKMAKTRITLCAQA